MIHSSVLRAVHCSALILAVSVCFPVNAISPKDLYSATGVQGGLVVHVGSGDGKVTAALRVNDRYLVQGLDTDSAAVEQARRYLGSRGLYGQITIRQFDGKVLPYVRETVDLIVFTRACSLQREEILRVLAPRGQAVFLAGDGSERTAERITKPVPKDTDEWSHFLHDAAGNAVAKDRRIGPPKCLRWVAGPRWSRSHEYPSSVQAVVTAGGRIFTIFDEAPAGVYRKLPQKSMLIARDAHNGVLLWKIPMQDWQPEFGTGQSGRWGIHHTIPRRLVTDGDRVYVTLRFKDAPVTVLDAATGEVTTESLPGTEGTDEIILNGGILVTKIANRKPVGATWGIHEKNLDETLVAVDTKTSKELWRHEHLDLIPYAFSATGSRLVYHTLDELVCVDLRTGTDLWRAPNPIKRTLGAVSNLLIEDGIVLFHGHGEFKPEPETKKPDTKKGGKKKRKPRRPLFLTAFDLNDGKQLWRHGGKTGQAAACTQPTDLFVCHGTVWCGGATQGRDLRTGKVTQKLTLDKLISPGHHYRCHRSKATERYLIWPKRGAEFVDLEEGQHVRNDWLRAPCFTGATPANGLLYAPSSQCFCYPGVKVFGYLAMSTAQEDAVWDLDKPSRLTRGKDEGGNPRAKTEGTGSSEIHPSSIIHHPTSDDWPMYRRDPERSGMAGAPLSPNVRKQWEVMLSSPGTQPLVVGDRLWVVEKDTHRVRCLDARNGADIWTYAAGGRIDSAPVFHNGLLLFGCRDGNVYCLQASDGALVWRFDAAPNQQQVVSFGQLESLWPIHGSVLVVHNTVYFAVGRSSFLDGGIMVCGLDAATGELRHQHLLEGPWPDIKEDVGRPFAMEGALPDLLVSVGNNLYMGRIKFDLSLKRLPTTRESDLGELDMGDAHLVATGGFLDDTGFDRLYWMHSHYWPGFYFSQQAPKSGQLVVFSDRAAYAVKYFYRRIIWSPAFFPAEQGYLLFADAIDNEPVLQDKENSVATVDWLPQEAAADKHRRGGRGVDKGTGYQRTRPPLWQTMIPLRVRAMVLAGDLIFAAGPPDVIDKTDPLAAFEGRAGAELHVYSATDGKLVSSKKLAHEPAFDGLVAAHGCLYMTTRNGRLIRFASPESNP